MKVILKDVFSCAPRSLPGLLLRARPYSVDESYASRALIAVALQTGGSAHLLGWGGPCGGYWAPLAVKGCWGPLPPWQFRRSRVAVSSLIARAQSMGGNGLIVSFGEVMPMRLGRLQRQSRRAFWASASPAPNQWAEMALL
jgi:hypothetical protein